MKIVCAWVGNLIGMIVALFLYLKKFKEIDFSKTVEELHAKVRKEPDAITTPLKEY